MYFISIISLISLLNSRRFEGVVEHFKGSEVLNHDQLYKIYTFMKMKTLLKTLESNSTSIHTKLQYIDKFNNEFYNISLPTIEPSISQPNITNGGLLDDWNYDIFF